MVEMAAARPALFLKIAQLREDVLACARNMNPQRPDPDARLTPAQQAAVTASGNVLVMAGAGTGKTQTLVERCLHCLCAEQPPASLEEILIVTFTEAAAAEMRQRLRERLEEKLRADPGEPRWAEQLALFDTAHIGTLHSFCLNLVREHFHDLGLDPQPTVLDEGTARLLADETLEAELQDHYAGENALADAVRKLIQVYGSGRDQTIRALVLQLHDYAQTRPDADSWLARQLDHFAAAAPDAWCAWLLTAVQQWRRSWLPVLDHLKAANEKAAELAGILQQLPENASRAVAADILEQIVVADSNWPSRRKTILRKPVEDLFDEVAFLSSLAAVKPGRDPLAEDWEWARGHMDALLRLTQGFSTRFAARKREDGVADFHDLEQFALKLLWDFASAQPTAIAQRWRQRIRFVFVDEYQDINAAQDKIIQALSRSGAEANRFLVGDVKQSIYRFRLADPEIFREYARNWRGNQGQVLPLTENFRSREGLLAFTNSVFAALLREEVGGVQYDDEAQLRFGAPGQRVALSLAADPSPRVELLLRLKSNRDDADSGTDSGTNDLSDLLDAEMEARHLALRLKRLAADGQNIWDAARKDFRPVEWRDMAVLLRAPAGKAEIYAQEFQRAEVPLVVARGGFYDSSEILDLLSLLQLLDNPLQDVPAIGVLRSPLVGLSLDELAQVRLAAPGHFWTALHRSLKAGGGMRDETRHKINNFLERFHRWQQSAQRESLSQCLEGVLAETLYADWLAARPQGAQRRANVERFLGLAQEFDQFQRRGLYRFLKFIEAQRDAGVEPEVAPMSDEDAVRLMSIHQSKGLEFPVVAVADLAKRFNTRNLHGEIILDGIYGLCPRIQPPRAVGRYPSLPHWLAQSHQRRELWGEELRLLYVALTRARDTLILTGTIPEKKWEAFQSGPAPLTLRAILAAHSCADWLGLWLARNLPPATTADGRSETEGELPGLRWRIADDAELAMEEAAAPATKELPELDGQTREKLESILTWEYPFAAATRRAAKSSVTALRRQFADESDDPVESLFPAGQSSSGMLSAVETGTAHHRFLQFFALESAVGAAALAAEAERLEQGKILSAAERSALNLEDIAAFWNSDPGKKIRAAAACVRRELAFTARFSPAEIETVAGVPAAADLADEFVVVQGVVDLAVLLPEEIWLVDFKTDALPPGALPVRARTYAPQLRLYARALEKIYSRPVTRCWLHFLAARQTESL
jgi:ATP-dependent helicase/nuclease subunit A